MKKEILSTHELLKELAILRSVVYSLPVIFYMNEFGQPGDIGSCRTTWLNQQGLDFIGMKQEELTGMGFDFSELVVHPDDMALLGMGLKKIYPIGSKLTSTVMLRLKPWGNSQYNWFYCSTVVTETFEDRTMKKIVVAAAEIAKIGNPKHDLASALTEISRLNHERILTSFTKREKEILHLIAKGMKSIDISKQLFISPETVKRHRNSMIRKAGVKNSVELVALAIESGAITI
jgi:DNA-binding CsgD family transcriptional regulator